MSTEIIKTLSDVIKFDDRYDLEKVTFFGMTLDGTLVIPQTDLLAIYGRYLAPYITTYAVSSDLREKYRYRPYILSRDVYGSPSLAWLIMRMNDKECASKFYLKSTVRLIPKEVLGSVYDTIATKSSNRLSANHVEYLRKVK